MKEFKIIKYCANNNNNNNYSKCNYLGESSNNNINNDSEEKNFNYFIFKNEDEIKYNQQNLYDFLRKKLSTIYLEKRNIALLNKTNNVKNESDDKSPNKNNTTIKDSSNRIL